MENAIAGVIGFGLGLALQITRAPIPKIERPSDDAFRWSPHDVRPARWNVIGRLREAVIAHASKRDDRP